MTEQPTQPLAGASAASSTAAARDKLPFPFWRLFGLGSLSCATWLGAALLDLWGRTGALAQIWPLAFVRALLVLTVPALILLFVHSSRMPAQRHPRAFFAVAALLTLIVALPALMPITASEDLLSLPLRVPTLSLGVALAAVDPLVIERWRLNRTRDSSKAMAAGVGFGLTEIVVIILPLIGSKPQCSGGAGSLACGGLLVMMEMATWGVALLSAVLGLFGAWLGYAIGARVARSDRW